MTRRKPGVSGRRPAQAGLQPRSCADALADELPANSSLAHEEVVLRVDHALAARVAGPGVPAEVVQVEHELVIVNRVPTIERDPREGIRRWRITCVRNPALVAEVPLVERLPGASPAIIQADQDLHALAVGVRDLDRVQSHRRRLLYPGPGDENARASFSSRTRGADNPLGALSIRTRPAPV